MHRRRSASAFDYLFGLEQFGIKLGLENISALLAHLGHPERAFHALHIAGTNGKGSVTAMADAALRAAGHRSARYTSPHLVELNERFVIDGRPVEDDALVDAIEDVRGAIGRLRTARTLEVEPTFFEATTAVAFELFRRAAVEVAVIEVGLGGRLDATNVITPVAAAITSIGFDHEQYLGTTLREIAGEKAGIIKPGIPLVVGPLPAEARQAIEEIARARSAAIVTAGEHTLSRYGDLPLALRGAHQRDNAAVAAALLEIADARGVRVSREAVRAGLTNVSWPGRLDLRRFADGREALLDAAHNPDGAAALAAYLREAWPEKPPLVFAAMRDKDVRGMFRALLPAVGSLVLTRASNPRSADSVVLAQQAREVAPALPLVIEPSRTAALDAAWRQSARIVVAGSIFLLGDVLKEREGT
ncbi:MAG TPA: folylpolyglutamate synthase/dihydrofolate synthase family protein [Vicinamibacterales bacterium]|jgi:dihydrofolate synthase/folylpolyglutamate synthase|nr:folylpolyglutamate synthase/dihydrofolate synthase family protein [Vicinamibacterales bacterium]